MPSDPPLPRQALCSASRPLPRQTPEPGGVCGAALAGLPGAPAALGTLSCGLFQTQHPLKLRLGWQAPSPPTPPDPAQVLLAEPPLRQASPGTCRPHTLTAGPCDKCPLSSSSSSLPVPRCQSHLQGLRVQPRPSTERHPGSPGPRGGSRAGCECGAGQGPSVPHQPKRRPRRKGHLLTMLSVHRRERAWRNREFISEQERRKEGRRGKGEKLDGSGVGGPASRSLAPPGPADPKLGSACWEAFA